MADAIDLNALADLVKNKTPAEIKKMFDELQLNTAAAVAKYNISLTKMVDVTKEKTKGIASAVETGVEDIKNKWDQLSLSDLTDKISNQTSLMGNLMGISSQSFAKGGMAVADLAISYKTLSSLPQTNIFEGLNRSLSETDRASAQTAEGFENLLSTFGKDPKDSPITAALFKNFQAADRIKQAEQAIIQTSAATGQLTDLLNESGNSFEGIEKKLNEYKKIVIDTSTATGLNAKQIDNWASSLAVVPGALSASIMPAREGSKEINVLSAALTTATGSGLKFSDVFSEINKLYARFGDDSGEGFQDTLQYVASLQKATNDLRIPLEYVRSFTDNASESFKFFGNNSQAAINIISRLGPALKESGLGPSAIQELTSNITSNIQRMDLAQRSFLSKQTGGSGGLRGGYEIELLKSQGKIDEIQKRAEESLRKQFGGRVVTLEEAAQDENAARQLTKQVQLITQGPTKLVNSEAEAYKFFEAMAKGIKTPEVTPPEDVLNEALQRGNEIQLRNNNLLNDARRFQESIAVSTELMANNTIRGVFGPGEGRNVQAESIRNSMSQAEVEGGSRKLLGSNQQTTASTDLARMIQGFGIDSSNFSDILSKEGVGGLIKSQLEKLKNFEIDGDSISNSFSGSILQGLNKPNPAIEIPNMINKENNRQNSIINNTNKNDSSNINISATCPECQKKSMEDIAIEIADGKIIQSRKGEVQHIHTGYNSGI